MFDIGKFIGGFALWKGEQFGKILFTVILVSIGLAVYHQITRDTQSQRIVVGRGGSAVINQQQPVQPVKEKNWMITGSVDTDKTFEVGLGYMF